MNNKAKMGCCLLATGLIVTTSANLEVNKNLVHAQNELDRKLSIVQQLEQDLEQAIFEKENEVANLMSKINNMEEMLTEEKNIFRIASDVYDIDYKLLVAIAQHETGNFTSELWENNYNAGGMIDGKGGFQKFNSMEEGVMEMARNLRRNYYNFGLTTIEQIQKKYCPLVDSGCEHWVEKVRYFYERV